VQLDLPDMRADVGDLVSQVMRGNAGRELVTEEARRTEIRTGLIL
jgi:hypothetical protein